MQGRGSCASGRGPLACFGVCCLQVAELANLAQLTLDSCWRYSADSLATLSRLSGSLTRLKIQDCELPDSLSTLTQLQRLCLSWEADPPEKELIEGALQHLTLLTCLVSPQHGSSMPWF